MLYIEEIVNPYYVLCVSFVSLIVLVHLVLMISMVYSLCIICVSGCGAWAIYYGL